MSCSSLSVLYRICSAAHTHLRPSDTRSCIPGRTTISNMICRSTEDRERARVREQAKRERERARESKAKREGGERQRKRQRERQTERES